MKTFQDFIKETSNTFETMYDLEAYISGKYSPDNYKDVLDFYNKLPKKPSILDGFEVYKGRLDRMIAEKGDIIYSITFDFTRRMMNIYETDNDLSQDVLFKTIPFQDLIES